MDSEHNRYYSIKIFEVSVNPNDKNRTTVYGTGKNIFENDQVSNHEFETLKQSITQDHSIQTYTSTNYRLIVNSIPWSPLYPMTVYINEDIKNHIIRTLQGSYGRGLGSKRGRETGAPFQMSPMFLDH